MFGDPAMGAWSGGDVGFLDPGPFNAAAGPSAPTLQQLLPYFTMRNVPAPPASQVPVPRGVLTGYSNNHGPLWLAASYGPRGGFGMQHMPRGVGQGFGPTVDPNLPLAQRGPGVWQPEAVDAAGWGRPSMAPLAYNAGFGPGQGLSTFGGYGGFLSNTALQVGPVRITWLMALLAIAGVVAYTQVPAVKKTVDKGVRTVKMTGAKVLKSLTGAKRSTGAQRRVRSARSKTKTR